MKGKIFSAAMAIILVTMIFVFTIFASDSKQIEASDNFSPTANVSLDFFNPLDIENAMRDAFLFVSNNFNLSFNLTLISAMNTTLNDLLDPLMDEYIQTIKENQEEFFNSLEIFVFFILITGLAFWRNQPFLDIVAAGVDIIGGLAFAAQQEVNTLGWWVGIMILMVGLWLIIHRIRVEIAAIRRRRAEKAEAEREESEEG